MKFLSPTDGRLTLDETYEKIINFIKSDSDYEYKLIVGTDSQPGFSEVVFVTAIVIYRIGRGGRYFYYKDNVRFKSGMKQRIFYEVSRSLEVASKLTLFLSEEDQLEEDIELEIHIDVGHNGPTNEIIREVTGMVVGSGFEAYIKPDAYAASTVADKFTR
ncbi:MULTISPECIES: ribonuclease H-like YkuK family protein [unclassified Halanaerobium]|uniref:ribonuclease H-like YkuK family protein n=1 Tax=unclassified Halanaerobium TaxID=2641197 RepID=UPI000DF415B5|nr:MULTISPECIES: ribonuclease H-like YkuK family protein [unclassified Halanaerobium]RCW49947.1 hypothetical protein DFR78_104120 [Halanaerobium sp. MA284_MarDTE_T2]RCW81088.1 hypothetical protein DER71_12616 [Halanaerobium sp. DL-01]